MQIVNFWLMMFTILDNLNAHFKKQKNINSS